MACQISWSVRLALKPTIEVPSMPLAMEAVYVGVSVQGDVDG